MRLVTFVVSIVLSLFVTASALSAEQNRHVARANEIMMHGFNETQYVVTIELVRDAIASARADGVNTRALEERYVAWLHESLERHANGHVLDVIFDFVHCKGEFSGTNIPEDLVEEMLKTAISEVHQVENMMVVSGVALRHIDRFRSMRDVVFDQMRDRARQTREEGAYCLSPLK